MSRLFTIQIIFLSLGVLLICVCLFLVNGVGYFGAGQEIDITYTGKFKQR